MTAEFVGLLSTQYRTDGGWVAAESGEPVSPSDAPLTVDVASDAWRIYLGDWAVAALADDGIDEWRIVIEDPQGQAVDWVTFDIDPAGGVASATDRNGGVLVLGSLRQVE